MRFNNSYLYTNKKQKLYNWYLLVYMRVETEWVEHIMQEYRKIIKTETAFDSLHMIQHLSTLYRMQTIIDSFHYQ